MVQAEGAGVDTGEDDLLGAGVGDAAGGAEGLLDGGGARASAGKGDGTIGAEIVAAVLYLEEGAGAVLAGVG